LLELAAANAVAVAASAGSDAAAAAAAVDFGHLPLPKVCFVIFCIVRAHLYWHHSLSVGVSVRVAALASIHSAFFRKFYYTQCGPLLRQRRRRRRRQCFDALRVCVAPKFLHSACA